MNDDNHNDIENESEELIIEDGFYQGRLVKVALCERNEKPVLVMGWELLDDAVKGIEVESNMHFTGKAETLTVEAMKACGWKETDDLLCMLGAVKSLLAKTTRRYGQQWSPWINVNKPMDRSRAKTFLAGLTNKGTASSPFAGKQNESADADPLVDDDGIPF